METKELEGEDKGIDLDGSGVCAIDTNTLTRQPGIVNKHIYSCVHV